MLEEKEAEEYGTQETQITLEDLIRINANSRRRNLLLSSDILLVTIGIMMAAFVYALRTRRIVFLIAAQKTDRKR